MKRILILLIGLLYCSTISAQLYTDQYIKDASKVALSWLSDINHNNYESAYELLTNYHKAKVDKITWSNLIDQFIKELGDFQNRVVVNKYFTSEIEGKENGFYVFIEYKTAYEKTIYFTDYLLLKQNDKSEWKIDQWDYEWQFIEDIED